MSTIMASLLCDDSSHVTEQVNTQKENNLSMKENDFTVLTTVSQWNANASGSVLAQKKAQQVKDIREAECCSSQISLSDSAVGYDDLEGNLINYGMREQELPDLNSLPDGHLPMKQTVASFSTPEKFGVTAGGSCAFDESGFIPIEEASLVLNSQIADGCAIEFCFNSSLLSDSVVLDEDFECDLTSPGMSAQEFLDLKLYLNGILPENWITTSFSTPEKSEAVIDGGFRTFDGSRFSPIEEASLVLNSPTANVCASKADKELETTSENFDLFESFSSWDMSGNVSREMLQIQDGNANSTLVLQLCTPQYCDPWAEDANSILEECDSDKCSSERSTFGDSCFGCSSFDSLPIQNNLSNCHGVALYLSKHQECDGTLEEHEFRKISNETSVHFNENEANKVMDRCDYNKEGDSSFPLVQSLMEVNEQCGWSYQEPLFLPITPNSYRHDENSQETPLYKMDPKCELKTLVQAKGAKSRYQNRRSFEIYERDTKSQCHEGRLPCSRKIKSATMARKVNPEAYRIRTPCLKDNSKPVKMKVIKNPFANSSHWKMNAIGSVLAKPKKHWVKHISEVNCGSNPTSFSNSSVTDDDSECDIFSSELSEQELSDLNLLPDEILPQKWINTPISTPKKSETVAAGGFHSFDGSRFSPIEEASLVLNSPFPHVFAGVSDEKEETASEDIDQFESLQTWEMSGNVCTEMLKMQHENVDSILRIQLHPTRYCTPRTEDVKSTSEECTSYDNCNLEKNTPGDSCFGYSSFESLSVQNLCACLGQTHYLSQHEVCDSMVSSDLTPDLEEHNFGNRSNEICLCSYEDEANKIVDELVSSATQPFQHLSCDSSIDMFHCDYNGGVGSILPLMQLDELNGCNNQEPLFWLLTPDSYLYDEDNVESSLYKTDSECKLKTTAWAKRKKSQHQRRELLKFSDDYGLAARDGKCQCHKRRLPGSRKTKSGMPSSEVTSEGCRLRSLCLTENSKSLKIQASKSPSMNFSQRKSNAAGSVLAKTMKKRVKEINEVECCSNPSSLSDAALIDDHHECDLISFEMNEQELLDLNLLPSGLLPEKWNSTPVSTPKKFETFTAGGFHSFDGSRFSPIQEASLILNRPIADVFVTVADKEKDSTSEETDQFESFQGLEMSCNVSTENLQIQDGNLDSTLAFQLHTTHYCDSWAEDRLVALAKQPSEHLNFDSFDKMFYSNRNEEWRSILPFDYNSPDVKSLSELENVGREREIETLKAELLEVKNQIKELGRLLKCTLRRTDNATEVFRM